jgi:hypothetical protein
MTIVAAQWPSKEAQVGVKTFRALFISVAGGTANLTVQPGGGRGIASVNYNGSTGQFLITFEQVGEYFLGAELHYVNSAGTAAASRVINQGVISGKTLTFNVVDLATPSAQNFAAGDGVVVVASWADSDAP